jgi:hypothetical protein
MAQVPRGPITVEVAPPPPAPAEGGGPSVSATFRNRASVEELPTTYEGCSTLFELFNKAVEEHADNRRAGIKAGGFEEGAETRRPPPPPLPARRAA